MLNNGIGIRQPAPPWGRRTLPSRVRAGAGAGAGAGSGLVRSTQSDFYRDMSRHNVNEALLLTGKGSVQYTTKDGRVHSSDVLVTSKLVEDMNAYDLRYAVDNHAETNLASTLLSLVLPAIVVFSIVQMALGTAKNPLQAAGAPAPVDTAQGPGIADVAGLDTAIDELNDIVRFLEDPGRYAKMGAVPPKGYILCGPPGVGKTLVSRAIAKEASVPLFAVSGSEFVEMFVGLGARRVRELFRRARKNAPCIVFVDEIDAIGKARSSGPGFGNDERDQTLNQLLTEMDGFNETSGVVVVASTNRLDILDKALLRPGRFDRTIEIMPPNRRERAHIVERYVRDIKTCASLDVSQVVDLTDGFTGADIRNLMNEAAICATNAGDGVVNDGHVHAAWERIRIGLARAPMSNADREIIACHEAGHAVVGELLADEYDVVHRVSIAPRGGAGGVTLFKPRDANGSALKTKVYMEQAILVALGGRAAEEVVYGKDRVTTGAAHDFKVATGLAYDMVEQFGFSDGMGPMSVAPNRQVSEAVQSMIDGHVRELVRGAYDRCVACLQENKGVLEAVASELVREEDMGRDRLAEIVWK